MGEAAEKLSGKLGIDTTDFKTGIREADRALRVLESGFRASAASLGDWTKDASGLEQRIGTLTQKMEIQKLKVSALKEEYDRLAAANGANSISAQEALIKLNKQTEILGDMESEVKNTEAALGDLSEAEEDTGDEAEETGGKVNKLGSVIGGIGPIVKGAITIVAGLAVVVAGVSGAITGLVLNAAEASGELVDLSTKTSITTTRLQELAYVGDQVGTSQESIVSSLTKLTRSMGEAQEQSTEFRKKQDEQRTAVSEAAQAYQEATKKHGQGSEEAQKALEKLNDENARFAELTTGDVAKAFETLGVSVTGPTGALRDNEAVFADALTALGKISNEAERDALSMSIFGKSAQELNPLIKAGADEMANLSKEAHEVGAVIAEEDVSALEGFGDSLASIQAGLKGTLGTLAGAFLPGFQLIMGAAGGYLKEFSEIVRGADGDIGKIAQGVGGLITRIVSDIATQAPALLQTGVMILQSIVQAIITALPTLIDAAINIILTLVQFLVDNLPMLIDAGLQAIIALATGITDALPTLIPAIVQALITIVNTLLENMPMLIDAALQLILGLAQGLIMALPILIAALPQIIDAIFNALVEAQPMIMSAAVQLVVMLATGILTAIPTLLVAIGELIVRLGVSLGNAIKSAPERGRDFVKGLADGIKSSTGILFDAVNNMITGMIQKIKDLLKMHSPSGVGEDIGDNLINSLGSGGERGAPKASQTMAAAAQRLVNSLKVSASGLGGPALVGAGAGSSGISIGDIYVDARGATDPKAVGEAVSDSVLKKLRSLGGA